MNIQVGDKITYKYPEIKNKIYIAIINNLLELTDYERMCKENQIEILKIERPKYEVVEEKKELLTKEEREFLKQTLKLDSKINYIQFLENATYFIDDTNAKNIFIFSHDTDTFKNARQGKLYTIKELGLEKI